MNVHMAGPRGVALFLDPSECGDIDEQQARELARDALQELGLPIGGRIEISAFAGRGGVMVLARLDETAQTAYFRFDSADDCLDAMRLCAQTPEVFPCHGAYYMAVNAAPREISSLSEFGVRVMRSDDFYLHLQEQQRAAAPN